MALMNSEQRGFCETAVALAYSNPFLTGWTDCERRLLGSEYCDEGPIWSARPEIGDERSNLLKIDRLLDKVLQQLHAGLLRGLKPDGEEGELYEELVLFTLYERFSRRFLKLALEEAGAESAPVRVGFYDEFQREACGYLRPAGRDRILEELPHVFACFYQIRRAFHFIFHNILGASMPIARLRASVWQSVFTHDMRRYRRGLFARVGQFSTLVTGPSGSGKELVARAIGFSRYVPFDDRRKQFSENFSGCFHALNLSALSPGLIESELFGHRKGAFTGASADRAGWLELCTDLGSVFLDEIGDLGMDMQVKLLRVIETRNFQRIGEASTRHFRGKVIAATNRDLPREIAAGNFRHDLYYRLCADTVRTPGLREQIASSPEELDGLVSYLCWQVAGEEYAAAVAAEVKACIARDLGSDYPWPGNIRELVQCIRNVMVRKEYHPPQVPAIDDTDLHALAESMTSGRLTADQLMEGYITHVYARCGTYEEAARRLRLDRRTVKARIDQDLLARLRSR